MHSSARRATDGTTSVRRACDEPNRCFISVARNEPRASAASSGTVIMDVFQPIEFIIGIKVVDQNVGGNPDFLRTSGGLVGDPGKQNCCQIIELGGPVD